MKNLKCILGMILSIMVFSTFADSDKSSSKAKQAPDKYENKTSSSDTSIF